MSKEMLRINMGPEYYFPKELGKKHIIFSSETSCFQVVLSQNKEVFFLKKKEKNWLFSLPQKTFKQAPHYGPRGSWTWNIWYIVPSHMLLFPAVSAKT